MTDRPKGAKCGARITGSAGDKPAGSPCGKPAGAGTDHLGFGNCGLHTGNTPTGKQHAEKERAAWFTRLTDGIDPHLTNVDGIAFDPAVEPRTRLAASKDWLDRAGAKVLPDESDINIDITIEWPE